MAWALAFTQSGRRRARALLARSNTDAAYKAVSAISKDMLGSVVCFEPLVVG